VQAVLVQSSEKGKVRPSIHIHRKYKYMHKHKQKEKRTVQLVLVLFYNMVCFSIFFFDVALDLCFSS